MLMRIQMKIRKEHDRTEQNKKHNQNQNKTEKFETINFDHDINC
jgi:hypothetical protein